MHKKHNQGQQFFSAVEAAADENGARPVGMPPRNAIRTEVIRLGFPESDADFIFDKWLSSGFKDGCSRRVKDWRAAIRNWGRLGYLPSQRKPVIKPGELMSYEILDDIATWTAFKKLDVHQLGAEYKEWCEKNNKPKLVASFIKLLNAKL